MLHLKIYLRCIWSVIPDSKCCCLLNHNYLNSMSTEILIEKQTENIEYNICCSQIYENMLNEKSKGDQPPCLHKQAQAQINLVLSHLAFMLKVIKIGWTINSRKQAYETHPSPVFPWKHCQDQHTVYVHKQHVMALNV